MSRKYAKEILVHEIEIPEENIKIKATVYQHMDELTRFEHKIEWETNRQLGGAGREYKL